MKRISISAILNIITVILFGWALVALYNSQMQFAKIMKNPEPPWEITVNMLPLFLFFVICIPIAVYLIINGKRKHKNMWKVLILPSEFEESDEREQLP